MAEKGENVFIDQIKYEDFQIMTELDIGRRFTEIGMDKTMKEVESSLEYVDPEVDKEYVIDMDEAFGDRAVDESENDCSEDEAERAIGQTSQSLPCLRVYVGIVLNE